MNIIETHKLSRWYGMADGVHGLELAVPEGSVCVMLGASKSGKSTAAKLLMNLLRPSEGNALVLGVDSRKLGPREFAQIGYLAEDKTLPMELSVREWLDDCRAYYSTWDVSLERTLLKQFALPLDRKLEFISRGMRVKAALLTVLAYRPKLLVLDEPFAGIDPEVRAECIRGLSTVAALGPWTILATVSEIGEFEAITTRVALLDEGRLRLHETTGELCARFRRVEVTGVTKEVNPVIDWLDWERAGAHVRFVEPNYCSEVSEQAWRERFAGATATARPMTLREIFLSMTRSGRVVKKAVAA